VDNFDFFNIFAIVSNDRKITKSKAWGPFTGVPFAFHFSFITNKNLLFFVYQIYKSPSFFKIRQFSRNPSCSSKKKRLFYLQLSIFLDRNPQRSLSPLQRTNTFRIISFTIKKEACQRRSHIKINTFYPELRVHLSLYHITKPFIRDIQRFPLRIFSIMIF
jgi:hypothetical protein